MSKLPDPQLRRLDDQTGLRAFQYMKMAPGRVFCDVLVLKASFALTPDGIDPTPIPCKPCMADEHRVPDAPMFTSLAQVGDLILCKPGADVFVTGIARAERPWKRWQVKVGIGPQDAPLAHYECAVTGARHWQHTLLKGWHTSESELAQEAPILYELAWGGHKADAQQNPDQWERFVPNPCGTGFDLSNHSWSDTPAAPRWEQPDAFQALKPKKLVGLGPVPRFWQSRSAYAGTHDAAWRAEFDAGRPDFAKDFDLRFYQAAHPKLQTQAPLRGNEALRLVGLLGKPWQGQLPRWAVIAQNNEGKGQLPLDTVHIDLATRQVHLVWHLTLAHELEITDMHLSLGRI
jgi:hypothetical protein